MYVTRTVPVSSSATSRPRRPSNSATSMATGTACSTAAHTSVTSLYTMSCDAWEDTIMLWVPAPTSARPRKYAVAHAGL